MDNDFEICRSARFIAFLLWSLYNICILFTDISVVIQKGRDPIYMLIFDKLFALLKKLGIPIKALAAATGIAESTFRRMRRNSLHLKKAYDPSASCLFRICSVLHCRVMDIAEYEPVTMWN